jgi:hypothetical protein
MRSLLLTLVLVAVPGCGNGNIGDLFSIFPPEAFNPDTGQGDDGGIPGLPGAGGTAEEVGFIEAAQGVDGDVRNIAVAQFGSDTYAFLSAGIGGMHVVRTTEPERVNSNHVATIEPATLNGNRCDTLAVIDNTYVVCVAVGTAAPMAVTVFHIPTLINAGIAGGDVTTSLAPHAGGPDIAVPGIDGNGGGVSGIASTFAIATGGPELGIGLITTGSPGSWISGPALTSPADPKVDNFIDVTLTLTGLFASVKSDDIFGVILATVQGTPPNVTISIQTPQPIDMEQPSSNNANIDNVIARDVVGPGNYPLDLHFDALQLYVTGDRDVRVFAATSPSSLGQPLIVENGIVDTIAVDALSGNFAIGQSTQLQVWSVLSGTPVRVVNFTFSGINIRCRGVKLTSSRFGNFVLCCAGERGLRVVRWGQG